MGHSGREETSRPSELGNGDGSRGAAAAIGGLRGDNDACAAEELNAQSEVEGKNVRLTELEHEIAG